MSKSVKSELVTAMMSGVVLVIVSITFRGLLPRFSNKMLMAFGDGWKLNRFKLEVMQKKFMAPRIKKDKQSNGIFFTKVYKNAIVSNKYNCQRYSFINCPKSFLPNASRVIMAEKNKNVRKLAVMKARCFLLARYLISESSFLLFFVAKYNSLYT